MAAEIPKFFFSYAREDSEFVLKLAKELRKAGVSLWLDQLDIRSGQRWDESVQAALESCQGMVAVLSPSAVTSQNFLDEVSYALEERKQVIPLLYRECAIPFRLRRVQYVNFTVGYENGFADLMRSMGLERATEIDDLPAVSASNRVVQPVVHEEAQVDSALAGEVAVQNPRREDGLSWERARVKATVRRLDEEILSRLERHGFAVNMATEESAPVATTSFKMRHPRIMGSLVGAACGAILGMISCLVLGKPSDKELWFLGAIFAAFPCGIAGLVTGTKRRLIEVTLMAAIMGAVAAALQESQQKSFDALLVGAPMGAFLGSVATLLWSIGRMTLKKVRQMRGGENLPMR